MRVLIVNNGVNYPTKIAALFAGSTIDVVEAATVSATCSVSDHDCIVLTGSNHRPIPYSQNEIADVLVWLQNQIKPLVGICYGAELLAAAYGGKLAHVGSERKHKGFFVLQQDHLPLGLPPRLCVYEAHQWVIESVAAPLQPLIISPRGVLLFSHSERPHLGVMFHPEKFIHETDGRLVWQKIMEHLGLPLSF